MLYTIFFLIVWLNLFFYVHLPSEIRGNEKRDADILYFVSFCIEQKKH